ncbi:MAG: D-alanyl-D-alanine carboxypeptidase family protein [Acidimicrobiales bacterium]
MAAAVVALFLAVKPPVAPHPPAQPRAWIIVDATSGAVLGAHDERTAMPPASLTKLLTALIAVDHLSPADTLTVSDRAAAEPATKISMRPGQVWTFQDALYALLLSSANDAAAAIGERLGGSLEGFSRQMQQAGAVLGLADRPVLADPAGLDDSFSVDGGNLLSARDLAIIARAVLGQPLLAQVTATRVYQFVGPDGAHHRLGNHNLLLSRYPGALGLKTGYTRKAGENLVAAAQRGGRTIITVVLGAPNLYADTSSLLDRGFATPSGAGDVLPPVHSLGGPTPVAAAAAAPVTAPTRQGADNRIILAAGTVMLTGSVLISAQRRRVAVRRRRRVHARPGGRR